MNWIFIKRNKRYEQGLKLNQQNYCINLTEKRKTIIKFTLDRELIVITEVNLPYNLIGHYFLMQVVTNLHIFTVFQIKHDTFISVLLRIGIKVQCYNTFGRPNVANC